jgi:hypothetical protein
MYKNTQIVIKTSAKLNTEKYFTHIKSITFPLRILSYQFPKAQPKTKAKAVSTNFRFFFFSSVK